MYFSLLFVLLLYLNVVAIVLKLDLEILGLIFNLNVFEEKLFLFSKLFHNLHPVCASNVHIGSIFFKGYC